MKKTFACEESARGFLELNGFNFEGGFIIPPSPTISPTEREAVEFLEDESGYEFSEPVHILRE